MIFHEALAGDESNDLDWGDGFARMDEMARARGGALDVVFL